MNRDPLLRASERWFRLLLRLYPADFRDELGEAVVETYGERSREAIQDGGVLRLAGIWWTALCDSLRNGLGERLRPAADWRRPGDWGRDMELVGRRLLHKPLFLAAVLGTLTIGLGIFAVVFTAVDKILIEDLPYSNPKDLYWTSADIPRLNIREGRLSGPQMTKLQSAGGVLQDVAGIECALMPVVSTQRTDAFHVNRMNVSGNLFELLGARPALGRGFRPKEAVPGHVTVVVLSDAFWRRLGANPAIIGTTPIRLGPDTPTVIGVMRPDFEFSCAAAQIPDIYFPLPNSPNPNLYYLQALVRARHGTSPKQLQQGLAIVGRSLDVRGLTLNAVGLKSDLVQQIRPALLALSFAAVFLLAVLCVNLASLLLARAAERDREFAVSRALGANGAAVVRAMLFEGGVLGLAGGIAGTVLGAWGTRILVALGPPDLPRRAAIALDWRIAAVIIAVGTLLGFAAAAAPAAWASRISLASLLSAASVRGSADSGRMRRSLIIAQVALSLVLVSTGALVVRSFERLLTVDPGFKPAGILTLRLSTGVLPKDAEIMTFLDRTEAALRALPGVTGVSAASSLPLSGIPYQNVVEFPGAPGNTGDGDKDRPLIDRLAIRTGYVETMGMHVLQGRTFPAAHTEGVHEALIDRHLAQQFFPESSPLGATVRFSGDAMTIVGVVDQARLYELHHDGPPQLYARAEDYPKQSRGYWYFVARTDRDPKALMSEARAAIRRVESRIRVSAMIAMDEIVANARSRERMSAMLLSGLSVGALLLVTMGLFGMISGAVVRRRGEMAVRLALGATHGRVIRLVVGEGMRMIASGLVIGIPGLYLAGKALSGFLIGVSPFDAPTLAAAAISLAGIALFACYLAASRVTSIAPECLLRDGG